MRQQQRDDSYLFLAHPHDAGAWDEFVETCLATIDRAARRATVDEDEARDVGADVLERFHADWPQIVLRYLQGRRSQFRVWLAVVARRAAIDVLRARHGRVARPRAIERLPELEQRLWRLTCVDDLPLTGAAERLAADGLFDGSNEELAAVYGAMVAELPSHLRSGPPSLHPKIELAGSDDDSVTAQGGSRAPEPPEAAAARYSLHAAWREVLAELGPEDGAFVREYFLKGRAAKEMARITGMAHAGEVYERVKRIVRRLRVASEARGVGAADIDVLGDFDWSVGLSGCGQESTASQGMQDPRMESH